MTFKHNLVALLFVVFDISQFFRFEVEMVIQISPKKLPTKLIKSTVQYSKRQSVCLYIWASLSEKRQSTVREFIFSQLSAYSFIRYFEFYNWESQKIPLKGEVSKKITSGCKGVKQLHILWPSVKDINCANFRMDLSVLLSCVKSSFLFLVIVFPSREGKSDELLSLSFEDFKSEINHHLNSGNIKTISFGKLNIPYIDDEVKGPRIREIYFKREDCLTSFGWSEGSFQLVCFIKSFCHKMATGETRRVRLKKREGTGRGDANCSDNFSLHFEDSNTTV